MVTAKAKITALGQNGKTLYSFDVMFNPEQYSVNKNNTFAKIGAHGRDSPLVQFGEGGSETLSLNLFFDTYLSGQGDVRNYTDKVAKLMEIDSDLHAPPICKFEWGSFSFMGVAESVNQTFTMFDKNGIPVRAQVTLSLNQYGKSETSKFSPDRTKSHMVIEGENLWEIAYRHYGDPQKWKIIADANDIDNPRIINAGVRLIIPSLQN